MQKALGAAAGGPEDKKWETIERTVTKRIRSFAVCCVGRSKRNKSVEHRFSVDRDCSAANCWITFKWHSRIFHWSFRHASARSTGWVYTIKFERKRFVDWRKISSLGNFSCSGCSGRYQSVQRCVREGRRSVGQHHRSRYEFGRGCVEIILSRTEGAVDHARNVRSVDVVHQ